MRTGIILAAMFACCFLLAVDKPAPPHTQPASKPHPPKLKPDAPPAAKAYFDAAMKLREPMRKEAAEEKTAASRELIEVRVATVGNARGKPFAMNFPTGKEKQAAVIAATKKLKDAESAIAERARIDYLPTPTLDSLEVGDAGERRYRVKRILNDVEVIAEVGLHPTTVWISGVPTKELADDDEASGVFEVVGTKKYQETRTIVHLKTFRISDYLD